MDSKQKEGGDAKIVSLQNQRLIATMALSKSLGPSMLQSPLEWALRQGKFGWAFLHENLECFRHELLLALSFDPSSTPDHFKVDTSIAHKMHIANLMGDALIRSCSTDPSEFDAQWIWHILHNSVMSCRQAKRPLDGWWWVKKVRGFLVAAIRQGSTELQKKPEDDATRGAFKFATFALMTSYIFSSDHASHHFRTLTHAILESYEQKEMEAVKILLALNSEDFVWGNSLVREAYGCDDRWPLNALIMENLPGVTISSRALVSTFMMYEDGDQEAWVEVEAILNKIKWPSHVVWRSGKFHNLFLVYWEYLKKYCHILDSSERPHARFMANFMQRLRLLVEHGADPSEAPTISDNFLVQTQEHKLLGLFYSTLETMMTRKHNPAPPQFGVLRYLIQNYPKTWGSTLISPTFAKKNKPIMSSLLVAAAAANRLYQVRFLVKQGADVNAKSFEGYLPLYSAYKHDADSKTVIALISEFGADLEKVEKEEDDELSHKYFQNIRLGLPPHIPP